MQVVTAYVRKGKIGMQAAVDPKLPKGRFKKALIKIVLVEHTRAGAHTPSLSKPLSCV